MVPEILVLLLCFWCFGSVKRFLLLSVLSFVTCVLVMYVVYRLIVYINCSLHYW